MVSKYNASVPDTEHIQMILGHYIATELKHIYKRRHITRGAVSNTNFNSNNRCLHSGINGLKQRQKKTNR